MAVAKTCEKVLSCLRLKVEHVFNNKVKVAFFFHLRIESYFLRFTEV